MDHTLHTGGAIGSDIWWENECLKYSIKVKSYSFETHSSCSSPPHKIILSQKELDEATPFLLKANQTLKRNFPAWNAYINNLLKRNYYQVKDCNFVVAIGELDYSKTKPGDSFGAETVKGGTGWAVQMAVDLEKEIFLFDQQQNIWYYKFADLPWMKILYPRMFNKSKNFAGIGTRELKDNGKKAIEYFCKINFEGK